MNPGGIACYAFVVKNEYNTIGCEYGLAAEPFSKNATNNVAEYTGLIKALEWLLLNNMSTDKVEIKSDSQLVVKQISGEYRVKSPRIIPLYRRTLMLNSKFKDIEIKWIARDQNKEADLLTRKAYNETLQNNPELLDKTLRV